MRPIHELLDAIADGETLAAGEGDMIEDYLYDRALSRLEEEGRLGACGAA